MQTTKEVTISYLNQQLETYLTAKEFAQFKMSRLKQQNDIFPNPSMQKESIEFQAQIQRCSAHIDALIECISWVKRVTQIKQKTSN